MAFIAVHHRIMVGNEERISDGAFVSNDFRRQFQKAFPLCGHLGFFTIDVVNQIVYNTHVG